MIRGAGDPTGPPDPRQWYFHIRYAHLVVECKVESIQKRAATLGQLHGDDSTRRDDSRQVRIRIGQLSDVIVLRGSYGDASIRVERVRIRAEQVLKGIVENNEVEFLVARGSPTPGWRTKTPYKLHIGQRWFIFLAKHDDGFLYPLAGHNGLLFVHGQELIYDGAVTYPYSRLSLTRTVSAALGSNGQAMPAQWDLRKFGNER